MEEDRFNRSTRAESRERNRSSHGPADRSTVSSRHSRPGEPLTHVHSYHLDDASIYQDQHHEIGLEDSEDVEDGRYPDLEKGDLRESRRQERMAETSDSSSTASDESPSPQKDELSEKVTRDGPAKSTKTLSLRKTKSSKSTRDPNLVTWDSPEDPANPKNWTKKQKWVATFVVSCFTFISPVSSSMVAPSLATMAEDFHISSEVETQLILSIFILAYAVGPLILGPLSEIYGRVVVLQLANLFFLVFNTACGAAKTSGMMIAFRFLAGLGGSAPLAIGGGVLSDAWKADERGAAVSVYALMPLLGPAIGPIAGGFITQYSTWRWTFYAVSIADAVIQVFGLFFLRESYPPTILHKKASKLRKETGNKALFTEFEHPDRKFTTHMYNAFARPFILLTTQPMVQVLALYMAYLYGIMYLMFSTFPSVWQGVYGESISIGSLNYISLGVGFSIGTQVGARLQDYIYRRLRKRSKDGIGKPEFRVPLMVPGSLLIPIGLFIYGWTAEEVTHWIGPNIGAAIYAIGCIMCFQCIQTFLVDAYTRYAASAIAAATVLRSLAGFGFPLFAPYMYESLGLGWGNSTLAFIALAIGLPSPFLLWFYGEKLRAKSPFAAGGGF